MAEIDDRQLLERALEVAAEDHLEGAADTFLPFFGTRAEAKKQLVEMWIEKAKE